MIENEDVYRDAVQRLLEQQQHLRAAEDKGRADGHLPDEIKRLTDPMRSLHLQLVEEVEAYERLLRGEFADVYNLRGVGQLLVAARIAQGLTQRKLAELLAVDESQVSRDERNEYHGVTVERAARVLDVLGIDLLSRPQQRTRPVRAESVDA